MNEVRVNRKAADRVASGHPWIFTSDITERDGAQPGQAIKVCDPRGRPLGTAHYSSSSQIASGCFRGRSKRSAAIFICGGSGRPRRIGGWWSAIPTPTA